MSEDIAFGRAELGQVLDEIADHERRFLRQFSYDGLAVRRIDGEPVSNGDLSMLLNYFYFGRLEGATTPEEQAAREECGELREFKAAERDVERAEERLAEAKLRLEAARQEIAAKGPICESCERSTQPGMFADKCVKCAWEGK
jgi:hypothetical protein